MGIDVPEYETYYQKDMRERIENQSNIQDFMNPYEIIEALKKKVIEQESLLAQQADEIAQYKNGIYKLEEYIKDLKKNLSSFVSNYNTITNAGKVRGQDKHSVIMRPANRCSRG